MCVNHKSNFEGMVKWMLSGQMEKGHFISTDATLIPVDGADVSVCVYVCVFMFSILLTASVWAPNRKEPTGRSVLTQVPVKPVFFIIFQTLHSSLCSKDGNTVRPEFSEYSSREEVC